MNQNKHEFFEIVENAVSSGLVTKEEVVHFVNTMTPSAAGDNSGLDGVAGDNNKNLQSIQNHRNTLVSKILYIIGGIVALSGVFILLGNNWERIGFMGQWFVTIGLGLVTYISAFITSKKKDLSTLSQVFFTVSSVLLFWGGYVWYRKIFPLFDSTTDETITIGTLLFLVFATALYVSRKPVLHLISGLFFTVTYYALVVKLLQSYTLDFSSSFYVRDISIYSAMVLGVAYLAYAFWLKGLGSSLTYVHKVYNFFGFSSILLAGLFLDGIWDFFYAFLAIGCIALSIRLKNSIGLVLTSISIGIYCIKISVTYFADDLGFPFILLCSGLLIIGLGYLTYYLNKKYINQQS